MRASYDSRNNASSGQGAIVGGPVLNAVLRLVRGIDSRLHPFSLVVDAGSPARSREYRGSGRLRPQDSCTNAAPRLRSSPGPNECFPMVARDRHRLREQAPLLPPRGPQVPTPHLRQILVSPLWSHAGALLWHTRFGNTIYGATTCPPVTLTMARYACLTWWPTWSRVGYTPSIGIA